MRNFGQKHELLYLGKICCVKSGFQILYAVEQFSSLFSKDKLKQGAHIHQTHDPPSPRMSWENSKKIILLLLSLFYLPCGSQPTAPTCVVRSWHLKGSPRKERVFYTQVFCATRRSYHLLPRLLHLLSGKCRFHVLFGRGGFCPPS